MAAAYWTVRQNGFVNLDDTFYITNNPKVLGGLKWSGLKWAFTTGEASNWHPLTWLSHMLDCELFGGRAGLHHLEGLFWHIANVLLLFGILRRATDAPWRSATVAALFALHPLHVESVAWAAERKDVLSTFFGFLAVQSYMSYAKKPSGLHYSGVMLLFAASLLCKPMWVTFPFLLLLLDFWPLRRLAGANDAEPGLFSIRTGKQLVLEKIPLVCLSAGSSAVTYLVQKAGGSMMESALASWSTRAMVAALGYVGYLEKMVWPVDLVVLYPYPSVVYVWEALAAAACLATITAATLWLGKRRPYLLVGWFWYLGMLVPVIGFVQVGSQAMADRYTYVPLIGIFIMLVWGVADLGAKMRHGTWVLGMSGAAAIVVCMVATWNQVQYWRDSVTLLSHSLAIYPESAIAQHNLGHAFAVRGDYPAAMSHFEEAIRLWPDYPQAIYNLANALNVQGREAEAIPLYRRALQLEPTLAQAHYGLATALTARGEAAEARDRFLEALRLKPDFVDAHVRYGNLLVSQNDAKEAIPHFLTALEIRPDCVGAHVSMARILARQTNFFEAAVHYRAAIAIKTNEPSLLNDLAWILATDADPRVQNVPEAIRLAARACEVEHDRNPKHLDTLGVAYSQAGNFSEAIETARKGAELARSTGNLRLALIIEARLGDYERHRSYGEAMR